MKIVVCVVGVLFLGNGSLWGQQMTIGTPHHSTGSRFSESIGTRWGVSGKDWFLRVGGNPVTAPFGGDPLAGGLRTGYSFQKGNTRGYFEGWAGQNYSARNSVTVPSVTIMNGQQGYIGAGSVTPFVIGTIPVVGGWDSRYYPPAPPISPQSQSVLQEKLLRLEAEKKFPRKELPPISRQEEKKSVSRPSAERPSPPSKRGSAEKPALSVSELRKRRASSSD
ncbi:MAG: hypothetical protein Q4D62_11175 [Planctomycetia bacterium]|nr:hypothetical protein [Planctomycetia bacterium]